MFKLPVLAALTLAFSAISPTESSAQAWNFYGFLAEAEVGCPNKMLTRSGYVWIRRDDDRTRNYNQLKARYDREYPEHTTHAVYEVKPGKPHVIARVEAVYECPTNDGPRPITIYRFFDGPDRARATEQIEAWRRGHSGKIKEWSVVEWLESEEQLRVLNSQPLQTVIGRPVS